MSTELQLFSGRFARLASVCAMSLLIPLQVLAQDAASADSAWRQSSSLAYFFSKGQYGQEQPTYVRYMPYTHEFSIPGWRFKTSLPVLEIDGPGNILIDVGNIGRESSGRIVARGIGDLVLSATYELPVLGNHLPFFDLTVDLKLPLADERQGLGTGRPDLGIQIDGYQNLGLTTFFAAVGYRYRHRSPVFDGLKDSFHVSLGLSRPVTEQWQAGLIYDYRQAASAFSGETHEILPYLSWSPDDDWSLMIYTIAGLTIDSADKAFGIQMTRRW